MNEALEALARIALMSCRCIDDGKPCAGCTKAGREAPKLAYQTLKKLDPEDRVLHKLFFQI